jgi:hypothetical protein
MVCWNHGSFYEPLVCIMSLAYARTHGSRTRSKNFTSFPFANGTMATNGFKQCLRRTGSDIQNATHGSFLLPESSLLVKLPLPNVFPFDSTVTLKTVFLETYVFQLFAGGWRTAQSPGRWAGERASDWHPGGGQSAHADGERRACTKGRDGLNNFVDKRFPFGPDMP